MTRKRKQKAKARKFWLVLFTNIIGEKTGHVYHSKRMANYFNYPKKEIVRVSEVLKRKKK